MFSMWCLIKNWRFRFSFRVVLVFCSQQLIVNKLFKWFYSILTCAPIWTDLSEYNFHCFPDMFCNLSQFRHWHSIVFSDHWHGHSIGRWKCPRAYTKSIRHRSKLEYASLGRPLHPLSSTPPEKLFFRLL